MPLFVVVSENPIPEKRGVRHLFGGRSCIVNARNLSARQVAERLGIGEKSNPPGRGFVVEMDEYYGYADEDIVDWIKNVREKDV